MHQFDWRVQECRLNQLPQYVRRSATLTSNRCTSPGVGPAHVPRSRRLRTVPERTIRRLSDYRVQDMR
ncbi:hypothetical protein [Sinorhizobium meliloti]|uniref:hypothetical protein n=1 Tax=Rhizobium meliloti TaxID=382 RepID=UPI000FD8342F|nr:hypothetical protein [Sinorhizobium meliloti]MQW49287.1 hypothetical protein [Sinorhizobium meliloti]RVG08138.1 hypothetical protein CN231_27450 [Sinorhizobium meliloti]RVO62979.1 hypothetical protein CN087_27230 [Sinorhizobium meliloti]